MHHILTIACAFFWFVVIAFTALNYSQEFSTQALFTVHLWSVAVSLTIICLISKFKKALLDYTLVLILTVRCIETFILMHLAQN